MNAATELSELVRPLLEACATPAGADRLLRELGVLSGPSLPAELPGQLTELAAAAQAAIDAVLALDDPDLAAPLRLAGLAEAMGALHDAIAELGALSAEAVQDLAPPFDAPELWPLLADALPAWMLVGWLRERHRPAFDALVVLGVVGDDGGFDFERLTVVAGAFGASVADTLGAAPRIAIGPLRRASDERGATPAPPEVLIDAQSAGRNEAAPLRDGRRLEIALPAGAGRRGLGASAEPTDGASGPGLAVSADGLDALELPAAVGADWTVETSGGAGVAGLVVGGAWTEPLDGSTLSSAEVVLRGAAAPPWAPIGAAGSTRIELAGATLTISGSALTSAPELRLALATEGLRFVLAPGEGDSFVVALLGSEEVAADVALSASWSPSGGLAIGGAAGLAVRIPLAIAVGPLSVDGLTLALAASAGESVALEATIDLGAELAPFAVSVNAIGLRAELRAPPADGVPLGPVCLALAFRPPDGAGFSLDLAGIASGGGFAAHDAALGRYSGALALDLLGVGLGATVVVDTEPGGDPDGWALFASVYATFPSLPLGFGFFLSGVGGIVCVGRTLDSEALAAGLRSGAVDALLFPDDPLADAALILDGLDAWFPLAEGSAVVGAAATIDWGVPALLRGELAVALSFPELEVLLLGSVSTELPDERAPLLELHMDVVGTLDPSEATASVVAGLYDSALLRTIQLTGDMAMYARFGSDPYFLLAVGGYHPSFEPPVGLPASVTDLRRVGYEVALGEDVWFGLAGYFAVTSNTLQFGAQATIEASARFLGVTYTASGSLGFDVLLVLTPFSFSADAHAAVEVTAGGAELIVAELSVHLEGPEPWYATGYGRFEFLGIGVRFEFTVGGAAGAAAPARVNVLDAVVARLADPAAWRGLAPSGPSVQLADDGDDAAVRPDAELEALQADAPLERELDVYGVYAIDGPTRLDVDGAGLGDDDAAWEAVQDWFAPAQYDAMTRAQKLAAPSYEQMTAGVRLTSEPALGADARTIVPDYEVHLLEADATRELGVLAAAAALADVSAARVLDPAWRATRPRAVTLPQRLLVVEPAWTLVDSTSGEAVAEPGSYRDAVTAQAAAGPAVTTRVAPVHAARRAA